MTSWVVGKNNLLTISIAKLLSSEGHQFSLKSGGFAGQHGLLKMIKTLSLTKYFGKLCAVDDLTLEVDAGEIFGFLGPNGAGKTTTINMLTGLLRPTSGTATLGGYDIQKQSLQAKAILGLMPDTPQALMKL